MDISLQTTLGQVLSELKDKRAEYDRAIAAMEQAISDLSRNKARDVYDALVPSESDYTNSYRGLPIREAVRRYLGINGQRTVNEIATALREGGLRTKSKHFSTVVRNTLKGNQSKDVFSNRDGKWDLAPSKGWPGPHGRTVASNKRRGVK